MAKPQTRQVKVTINFEDNLADIETFWTERGHPPGFDALLDVLSDDVIPALAAHPDIGPDFLKRRATSLQAQALAERIERELISMDTNGTVREFIMDDYMVLYAVLADAVYLLAIKHHKQLSFEFRALWPRD